MRRRGEEGSERIGGRTGGEEEGVRRDMTKGGEEGEGDTNGRSKST